ncbi:hypothetical protein SLS60_000863 [Paraconiothyrium brasiliense]|uniref:Fibronectin type-III domain-containing protein n=1 Tax=Paraconiothyrium brasiliense TaxID=300254 RepID=A0ABR3S7F9_9PLEO
MFPDTAHSLYWPPDVARYNMEALVFLSSGWLKTACVLLALFWVAFRAYRVLSKPVEELINLLGLEVPVAPLVSLAGIKADGVLLHWKPPDQRSSVVKYVIRINGIDIGDVSPQETSVTIENLQPDHHYVIRIVTLNAANFQAPSIPIRLRTLPAESEQFYGTGPQKEIRDGAQGDDYNPTPIIRPNKNLVDFIVPSTTAPAMTREHSNSVSRHRRSEPGRRNSPASGTAEQARAAQEAADSQETIKQLTEKLDSLRRELEDMEKQIQDEEQEFIMQKALLVEKRDEKKASLKEKEDASRDLRKEVAILERANASAQAKRSNQERLLQKKEAERRKLKDDMAKWEREAGELRTAAEGIQKDRTKYEALSETRIKELKGKHEEELQTNKSLEDVIREKGIQIKTLEEERKLLEDGEDVSDAQDGAETEAEDRRWMELYSSLQQRYAEAWQQFNEAEHINKEASARLAYLQQRRMSQPQVMSVTAPEFVPARRNSGVRSRPLSMREPLTSANLGGFIPSTAAPFNSGIASTSPSYKNPTPYFNPVNGMALPPPSAHTSSFSQADIESLTGGAPMSPTAGALLPSGLFGDGMTDDGMTDEEDPGPPLPSLDPSPNLRHVLPGLGAPGTLEQVQSPSSPVSVQSRSPFASPRESVGQLGFYPSNENALDSDRRSIRSTSSSFKNPPTTRFGSLFGLHRQRGKTLDQGPPLGSLKSSQSQSLPRQEHEDLDPIGTRRRRGSHSGGAWYNAFIPSKAQPEEFSSSPKHVATRKRAFNMFGTKGDPWLTSTLGSDRPSSPRQGSTKSGEANVLPRPSTESQTRFGWNVDAFNARSSPLGVDWSINNTNSSSWSRMPSRRPSIQHGSTVSLLNDGLLHDDIPDFPSTTRSPTQAPIGTRPQSSASHMAPLVPPTPPKMLNPDAPTFTFGFGDKDIKAKKAAEKAEKAAEKEAKRAEKKAAKVDKSSRKQSTIPEVAVSEQSSSPVAARFSRDNYSLSTADYSETSPRESLDQSGSLTTSELQPPASLGKESFMQKLSRKSSSSQFLQFGKGQRSLFSKKSSEAVTPDETDEDGGGLSARTTDSPGASPSIGTPKDKSSALSWSSIKRIGKRGDKTPSLHESVASETTGDEDDEAAEGLGVATQ